MAVDARLAFSLNPRMLGRDLPTPLPSEFEEVLRSTTTRLVSVLGRNLYSLILYGSAVRGDADPNRSDLNLLLILEASTAPAHQAIRDALHACGPVQPFVVERGGFPRAIRVFGLKFQSIQRDYRVLHGADPLAEFSLPIPLRVFLAEQELRNLRMRLVNRYVTSSADIRLYRHFLLRNRTRFFIVLSDVLRCAGRELPRNLPDRIPCFQREWQVDAEILNEILSLASKRPDASPAAFDQLHAGLIGLMSTALKWMEEQWPTLPL